MSSNTRSRVLAVVAGSAVVVALGATGAVAGNLIDSGDVRNNSLRGVDLENGSVGLRELNESTQERLSKPGPQGEAGQQGPAGPQGPKGDTGLEGAYYSVAYYNAGNTNAGAIATVACKAETDTAISGGVQVTGLEEGANARNTPVSSSFPGRMDWNTNAPRPDRLDGWIVQFGGNAGEVSDKNPEKTKIWALCVPGADIPVEQTFAQVD